MSPVERGGGNNDEGSVEISGRCLLFFAKFAAVDKYLSFPFLAFEVPPACFTVARTYYKRQQSGNTNENAKIGPKSARPRFITSANYNSRRPPCRCSRARALLLSVFFSTVCVAGGTRRSLVVRKTHVNCLLGTGKQLI